VLEQRYEKTEAGRAEIKLRALVNARVARNLLLVISPDKRAADWLGLVQGATAADLELLLQHGLVAAVSGAPGPAGPAPRAVASVSRLDYGALYAALSAHAKAQGVLKGYKLALEVEQCQDLAQLQALALDFIERQRLARGDAAARALADNLGL
jgi:hypothetical protein